MKIIINFFQDKNLVYVFLDKTAQFQSSSFYARGLHTGSEDDVYWSNEKLVYHTAMLNTGNHYNASTGEYTCPTTGVYVFTYSVFGFNIKQSGILVAASLYQDGLEVSQVFHANHNSQNTYITLSQTDVVHCKGGQRVWVQSPHIYNRILGVSVRNMFGGVLLYSA